MKNRFEHIGKAVPRQDGIEKVTGQARFADDISVPGQLHSLMLRVPAAHARIRSVSYGELRKSGLAVIACDAADVPGSNMVGPIKKDQPVFCDQKIVTPGDVVCMLMAENADLLEKARKLVKIDYEELPVLSDPEQALDPEAVKIHPEFEDNLIVHYPLRKGDVEKGFRECEFILEQKYQTQFIEHAYIEPEAVIATPMEGSKGILIKGSIQNPFTTRKVVAAVLDWPLAKVRVEQAELGGSFGGKDDTMNILSARAAVGALKSGRPVRIRYSREDSVLESYKRHPYYMKYKAGFNSDGRVHAMEINIIADGGAYASMSPFVTWRSVVQATGPYEIPNVHTDVRAVYTNNPYTGAMRGFGSPQPIFAQESLMDEIAAKLKMSPLEIRRVNGFKQGSVTASGQVLDSHEVNLHTVLDRAVEESGWQKKWRQPAANDSKEIKELVLKEAQLTEPGQTWKKGIGLAVSYRGCSLGAEGIDAAAAYLAVQPDGSAYLLSGLAENGQGLRTTFNIIAAEVLGIDPHNIYYLETNTAHVADSGPTVASRSTLMGGGAVQNAARIIRGRLEEVLQQHWKLSGKTKFEFSGGRVTCGKKSISFSECCQLAAGSGVNLSAIGWYNAPEVGWEEETGQGDAYFTYVYGCQVAEVAVNTATGEVRLEKVTAVHDPGTVINLLGAQGQVYGGVTQGAGYGLWEEISTHQSKIRELNFDQYLIPTAMDIGEINPVFVEGKDPHGAWGAKSLGEPTLELTAAAIANAVTNATGKRFFKLPLNLEELLLGRKLYPEDLKRGSA